MAILKRVGAALGTTVLAATALVAASGTAQASSWNCATGINPNRLSARAICMGNGPMRVAAYCDSDRYPYRTTIYGPWSANVSDVYASGCYISSAWYETL
ncbi:hypothetical protein AB0I68_33245 [Streptomyces sp. NPDC050448]|uniref:hypothetical protein n=1 Tax=Streptomyces sp. NPDC050448 TaxID=3155404 RepID=UPI003416088E